MPPFVRRGSRGDAVKRLQELLNTNLDPSPRLTPDGVFGENTYRAVIRYQLSRWLTPDGIVGPCTWGALYETELFVVYKPPASLIPQPTDTTCWAASTAMLINSNVPYVVAKAKAAGVDIEGGLSNDSDTDHFKNTTLLAKTFNLTLLPPMCWMPAALADKLRNAGPLMVDTLWDVGEYVKGKGSAGHMRVIAGMRGDGTGEGTTVLLYDPWAPNVGKIESVIYGPFIRKTPAATYQIFHR